MIVNKSRNDKSNISQYRYEIVNYFEFLINEIDLEAEIGIRDFLNRKNDDENNEENKRELEKIDLVRNAQIDEIRLSQEKCLKYLSSFYSDIEEINDNFEIFNKIFNFFCFRIRIISFFSEKVYLVSTDFYLSPEMIKLYSDFENYIMRYEWQSIDHNSMYFNIQVCLYLTEKIYSFTTWFPYKMML